MNKRLTMLAFSLAAAGAQPAWADGELPVSGAVETPNAVFFQPSQYPEVVWFFPKTKVTLAPVPPSLPGASPWRAAVVFKPITRDDLALMPAEWGGKAYVPYVLRPATECKLYRLPEMHFVIEEIKAKGRDVSAANPPVCRFSFTLPPLSPDLQARLNDLVGSGALIERSLDLALCIESEIAWTEVRAALAAVLGAPMDLTLEQARAAVESALATPALDKVRNAVTPAEAQAFIDATLAELFVARTEGGQTLLRLLSMASPGSFVYCEKIFRRTL